jgi:cell division protein FtsA
MPGKTQLAVGLDVGSSRTRAVICALDGDHLRCLSFGLAVSSGWTKGRITDQDAVAESIRAAVADAERGAGVSVEAATLGMGGRAIHGAQGRGLYEFRPSSRNRSGRSRSTPWNSPRTLH